MRAIAYHDFGAAPTVTDLLQPTPRTEEVLEAVGDQVTRFTVCDEVFGALGKFTVTVN